jgi:hypothetical protein
MSRYVALLLGVFAAVLAAVIVLNVAANPARLWRTGGLSPDPGDPMAMKTAILDAAGPFDTLVLGDSRAQRLEPAYVRQRTGSVAFNGAVTGGGVHFMPDIVDLALRRSGRTLRRVVVLLGPETLTAELGEDRSLLHRLELTTSLRQTEQALLAVGEELGLERGPGPWTYGADGVELRTASWDFRQIAARGGPSEKAIDNTVRIFRREWRDRPGPSELREWRRFVDRLKRDGLRLTVVLMPNHPELVRRGGRLLAAAEARTRALLEAERVSVVDLTQLRSFGGDPRWFADGVHMGEPNMRRLVDAIARSAPGAL